MKVFWSEGYDRASVDTLARATGMPRATLYHLYGDKEGLFLAALGHYSATRVAQVAAALGPKGTLHDDLSSFFSAVVDLALSEPAARGCLISCVLADVAGANPRFQAELDHRFLALEARIQHRLDADVSALGSSRARAIVIASVARGLMLRARAGASRPLLEQVATDAVRLFVPHHAASHH